MKQGHFYFVSDSFYTNHDPQKELMQNKEIIEGVNHNRPCFFAFADKKEPDILWCVPISSKIPKYEAIYNRKIEKQKLKGVANPKCNTIRFGDVMGQKRAFLIQNMFPVTYKYISSTYIDRNTNRPVTLQPFIEKDIISNANEVLKLTSRGIPIVFTDVNRIYTALKQELTQERTHLAVSNHPISTPATTHEALQPLTDSPQAPTSSTQPKTVTAVPRQSLFDKIQEIENNQYQDRRQHPEPSSKQTNEAAPRQSLFQKVQEIENIKSSDNKDSPPIIPGKQK